ncbi:MAG: hypothetical protein FWE25_04630 [Lachnospiraceae bacterium]|nr:hypothetical protein [Lachnospiraceae bacterium]
MRKRKKRLQFFTGLAILLALLLTFVPAVLWADESIDNFLEVHGEETYNDELYEDKTYEDKAYNAGVYEADYEAEVYEPKAYEPAPVVSEELTTPMGFEMRVLEPNVDINAGTVAELHAALLAAPVNASQPWVINITANIPMTTTAPSAANGRIVGSGRNIVIQSEADYAITTTTARHFQVGGDATLTIGSGVTLRRAAVNTTAGGGVIVNSTGTLILNGGNINQNRQVDGGGVRVNTGGRFVMLSGRMDENAAAGGTPSRGGAVFIEGSTSATGKAQFDMYGGVMHGNQVLTRNHVATSGSPNSSTSGGGAVANLGVFNLFGGTISGSHSVELGGAVFSVGQGTGTTLAAASTFNMFGGTIYNNTVGGPAGGRGGAGIGAGHNSIFNMYGGSLDNNRAMASGGDGGGVESFGRINIYGGSIINNWARHGGGVNNHQNAVLELRDPNMAPEGFARETALANPTLIAYNEARQSGGGIVMRGGGGTDPVLNIFAGVIRDNTASGTQGSPEAAFLQGGGGGIFFQQGVLNLYGGEIRDNTAVSSGGGIGAGTQAAQDGTMPITVNMFGGIIDGNTAHVSGGGIGLVRNSTAFTNVNAMPDVRITGGIIRNNVAPRGAGVFFAPTVSGSASGTMPENMFLVAGDAVVYDLYYEPNISMTTGGTGGANANLRLNIGGDAQILGDYRIAPAMNLAGAGTGARANNFHFTISDNATFGNGLDVTPNMTAAGTATTGTATRTNTINFVMNGGTILGRENPVVNGGVLNFTPNMVATNGAAAAVRTNNINFTINDGVFRGGIATERGGGIYFRPRSTIRQTATALGSNGVHNFNMTLNSMLIEDNHAGLDGGGMYVGFTVIGQPIPLANRPAVNISNANTRTFQNNTAIRNGGGIYIESDVIFNGMANTHFLNNTAEIGQGGGIFVETPPVLVNANEIFTMTNSSINGNRSELEGASIYAPRFATININDSSLNENYTSTDGAGLHFSPLGTGTFIVNMNGNSSIDRNNASTPNLGSARGGGLFLGKGRLNMSGTSSISGNVSRQYGGGIYVNVGSEVVIGANSRISDNVALENGGGIYAPTGSVIRMTDAEMRGNRATGDGGAIFTEDYIYEPEMEAGFYGNLYLTDVLFYGNRASLAFLPPENTDVLNITYRGVSIHNHPLNNYDINFVLPLTGELSLVVPDLIDFGSIVITPSAISQMWQNYTGLGLVVTDTRTRRSDWILTAQIIEPLHNVVHGHTIENGLVYRLEGQAPMVLNQDRLIVHREDVNHVDSLRETRISDRWNQLNRTGLSVDTNGSQVRVGNYVGEILWSLDNVE